MILCNDWALIPTCGKALIYDYDYDYDYDLAPAPPRVTTGDAGLSASAAASDITSVAAAARVQQLGGLRATSRRQQVQLRQLQSCRVSAAVTRNSTVAKRQSGPETNIELRRSDGLAQSLLSH